MYEAASDDSYFHSDALKISEWCFLFLQQTLCDEILRNTLSLCTDDANVNTDERSGLWKVISDEMWESWICYPSRQNLVHLVEQTWPTQCIWERSSWIEIWKLGKYWKFINKYWTFYWEASRSWNFIRMQTADICTWPSKGNQVRKCFSICYLISDEVTNVLSQTMHVWRLSPV